MEESLSDERNNQLIETPLKVYHLNETTTMTTVDLPRKALIAVTSASPPKFHVDGAETGAYYSEVLHPYQVLVDAGFVVEIATETGSLHWDPHSLSEKALGNDVSIAQDKHHPFNEQPIYTASHLQSSNYGLFFAAGGHGASYDFPNAKHLQAIASDVASRGGVVAAVCHGPVIFANMKGKNGEFIAKNRVITGFPIEGELEMKTLDKMREHHVPTVQDVASAVGAHFQGPDWEQGGEAGRAFGQWVRIDDFIVTGANPASATPTASDAVKLFDTATKAK